MQDWSLVVLILGSFTLFIGLGLAWLIWDSRNSMREWTFIVNENTRRSIERLDRRAERTLRAMDAHIAMILERVDRPGQDGQ